MKKRGRYGMVVRWKATTTMMLIDKYADHDYTEWWHAVRLDVVRPGSVSGVALQNWKVVE